MLLSIDRRAAGQRLGDDEILQLIVRRIARQIVPHDLQLHVPALADRQLRERIAERRETALQVAEAARDFLAVEFQRRRLVIAVTRQSVVVFFSLSAATKPPSIAWNVYRPRPASWKLIALACRFSRSVAARRR